jgi:hypothetical protein
LELKEYINNVTLLDLYKRDFHYNCEADTYSIDTRYVKKEYERKIKIYNNITWLNKK